MRQRRPSKTRDHSLKRYKIKKKPKSHQDYTWYCNHEDDINRRISYILKFWLSQFDRALQWWSVESIYDDDKAYNHFTDTGYIDYIVYAHSGKIPPNDFDILDKYNNKISLAHIPIRFLFEDFEQEVVLGKQIAEKANQDKKEAAKKRIEDKQIKLDVLLKHIEESLSDEDLLAILSISEKQRKQLKAKLKVEIKERIRTYFK